MSLPRCPFYVGLDSAIDPMTIVEYGDARLRPAIGGFRIIYKGIHAAAFRKLGQKQVGATLYNVWELLYFAGDPRKIWRYFKNAPDLVGPFTISTAPTALLEFLADLNDGVTPVTPWVIAGDVRTYLDSLNYVEGADPSGDDDEIVET